MKYLYLHVGFGKTGTSSLQKFCFSNIEFLRENGFLYVDSLGVGDNFSYALTCYLYKFTYDKNIKEFRDANLEARSPEVLLDGIFQSDDFNNFENHIISSEIFSNLNINDLFTTKNLIESIYQKNYRIIFYVRNPFDWILSVNKQLAREIGFESILKYPVLQSQFDVLNKFFHVFYNQQIDKYNYDNILLNYENNIVKHFLLDVLEINSYPTISYFENTFDSLELNKFLTKDFLDKILLVSSYDALKLSQEYRIVF